MDEVKVLIVDDQPPFRLAAAGVVEATEGFRVSGTAASGEDAVELAGALRPDLVLMDVCLPGISGLEATRLLRRGARPAVVVLVSTYDASEFGDEPTDCGAAAYLAKSAFDSDRLVAIWQGAGGDQR